MMAYSRSFAPMERLLCIFYLLVLPIRAEEGIVSNCTAFKEGKGQGIPNQTYWAELRDAYVSSVSVKDSTIDWPSTRPTGLNVNTVAVGHSPEKGRGLFASTFLPAGTIVWEAPYHAEFPTQAAFEDFFARINKEQACDILQWCYAMDDNDDDEENEVIVACVLDEGTLFNHGDKVAANVGYPESDGEDDYVVALRDIEAGEELLQDYVTFEVDLSWFETLMDVGWGHFGEWDDSDGEDKSDYSAVKHQKSAFETA